MKTRFLFALTMMAVFVAEVMAQPGLPSDPIQAPIDGGLGILAVAGGAYALKKLRDRRKASYNEEGRTSDL